MPPLTEFIVRHGKTSWQKHGQDQYALKNYPAALEAFTKAIQSGQGDQVGILDNRAATFCALGNLDSALKDGRRMIKTEKKDPRGYLRTAKVLQLMKRFDEAFKIYDYGLEALDPEDKGLQQIRDLRAKLDKAINGPPRQDPFTILPRELVSLILQYLDLKDLLRLVRVSKLWQQLSVSFAKAWSHLDLSIARRKVTTTEIRAYLRRFHSTLTHVTLTEVKENKVPEIVELLSRCPHLTSCEVVDLDLDMMARYVPFSRMTKLTSLAIHPDIHINPDQFFDILSRCHHIERTIVHLTYHGHYSSRFPVLPNLKSLKLNISTPYGDATGSLEFLKDEEFADKLSNLEELRVTMVDGLVMMEPPHGVDQLQHLRRYELEGMDLLSMPRWPQTLEHLTLSVRLHPDVGDPTVEDFKGMTNLKTFSLNESEDFTANIIAGVLTEAKETLRCLEIAWTTIDFRELKALFTAGLFENITHLSIAGIFSVDDKATSVIIDAMPNLKVLDLSSTKISPFSLNLLTRTDKLKLERLLVWDTEFKLKQNVIDYAQSRGIEIASPRMRVDDRRALFARFAEL